MKSRIALVLGVHVALLWGTVASAEITVVADHNRNESAPADFKFERVASPSRNDAASQGTFSIVDGRRDANGGDLGKLHDGYVPTDDDQPRENFFFGAGTDGGRLLVDLGKPIDIKQVNTYSWHSDTRGPQVYRLYASDAAADGLNLRPKQGTDPQTCGWTRIAAVDTRPQEGEGGGQHGVGISDSEGTLGKYRYLLFDVARTEADDPFGNTFYSEIDVVDRHTPPLAVTAVPRPGRKTFQVDGGKYWISVDTSETPDLTPWARGELMPIVEQWYPKIVELLPSEGYEAPRRISITFSRDMRGVAATGGTRVRCAASWFRRNLEGEAKGAVVHELVHVVQQYGRARRTNRNPSPNPGWLVEGIADYIRWFLYEPQSHGAEITGRGVSRARYDASYRVSANFLNWVTEKHDPELVRHLNAAAREGRYDEGLWKERTGHTLQALGERWKEHLKSPAAEPAS